MVWIADGDPRRESTNAVVNDELEACVDRLKAIILAERSRQRSMRPVAEQIVKSFRKDP